VPDRLPADARRAPLALLLLPAVILAVIALLQNSELAIPPAPSNCVASSQPSGPGHTRGGAVKVIRTPTTACGQQQLAQVSSERSTSLSYAWIGVVLMILLGLGLAVWLTRALASREPRASLARSGNDGAAARDRKLLVQACVELTDKVSSDSAREQLLDSLAAVGVSREDVPAGVRFDPSRHHAVDRVATRDRACHHLVAKTERPGFVDRGERLRYPEVIVYDADGG
jgi:molecular chaperone GrpE